MASPAAKDARVRFPVVRLIFSEQDERLSRDAQSLLYHIVLGAAFRDTGAEDEIRLLVKSAASVLNVNCPFLTSLYHDISPP